MSEGPDLGALLGTLDGHRVDYVIGGSVGAKAHGAPDVAPGDLDIVPATDRANLARLAEALTDLGAVASVETGAWTTDANGEAAWVEDGVERIPRPLDPAEPETFDHSFATPHGRLDVVPSVAGSYASLQARAERHEIAGHPAWVAHPIDLLGGMTGPRRPKDAPRVRHLRTVAAGPVGGAGVGFVGFRTDRFDQMVGFFRDLIRLPILREAPGVAWFRLGADAELHVYAESDPDHAFFTTGPVVGLRVSDVEGTRARLEAAGVEMLTDVERTDRSAWCHVRAPDGTVLEIIGPVLGEA